MTCSPKLILRVLIVDTSIALIPPFLMVAIQQNVPLHQLWSSFEFSFVYAHCIGSLAFAAIPRIWMATENAGNWARWSARAAAMLLSTGIGGLVACLVFVVLGWIPARLYWAEFVGSLKI